jgi:hypothetical protein
VPLLVTRWVLFMCMWALSECSSSRNASAVSCPNTPSTTAKPFLLRDSQSLQQARQQQCVVQHRVCHLLSLYADVGLQASPSVM